VCEWTKSDEPKETMGNSYDQEFVSQFGEDERLARNWFASKTDGLCVEVGAHNGVHGSTTLYFERRGWTAVLVEANPELAQQCREARPRALVVECAAVAPGTPSTITFFVVPDISGLSSVAPRSLTLRSHLVPASGVKPITVPAKTLDDILNGVVAGRTLDFITVDVEGLERDVLRGFDLKQWGPRVAIVERNQHLPDLWILRYMRRNGYTWTERTGQNDWYVQQAAAGGSLFTLVTRLWIPAIVTWPLAAAKALLVRAGVIRQARSLKHRARSWLAGQK
jgi:FkbM family methyltransferase